MEMTKQLLLNLSLLLVLLFFFSFYMDKRNLTTFPRVSTLYYFMFSIVLCILLTNKVNNSLFFDLRHVPLVIGTLYLGTGFPLMCVALLARSMLGIDLGFWISFITFLLFVLLSQWIHPWFLNQNSRTRYMVCAAFSIGLSILVMLETATFFGISFDLEHWIGFVVIPVVGTLIMAHAMEIIKRTILMQQQLVKTKKLEVVSQMGAAIAHEVRNPLTSAKGFIQLILEDSSLEKNKREEYLLITLQELHQAETVVHDYLALSKPSMDKVEEIQTNKEIEKMLKSLIPLSNLDGIEVKTVLKSSGVLLGDRQKFHQCFFNIAKNCIEAMPAGGSLTVETYDKPSEVVLSISDTGIGMTKEQIQRLGEPYYSTKEGKGTGLGMMVVYGIIRAMNGTITVKSQLDTGTTFIIAFPKVEIGDT
ncbi:histidine kinase [Bacillus sp. M6-12]|uniref:sensor histidine kinase n=1 Tax=Bacillus sp. M6-12 TaxID=2054166 RepID=UPI000C75B853|nr:HAMP domain-containing sensor histidine kinase [Bacillus sp. M6-12]PLS17402.1 histidine kinase [Bacillus sp. M6-12]